jgi:hypothetical protein
MKQLILQEPGIYDKCHADYANRDKLDLAWEKISYEGVCILFQFFRNNLSTRVYIVTEERINPMFS